MIDKLRKGLSSCIFFCLMSLNLNAQQAYFIDGFHGGIWGHYPEGYTKYIIEQLNKHPDWKINLEIEPDTWDSVSKIDPVSFEKFKEFYKDQTESGRLEYVNPSYGQSYLFNTSGESIIRQFEYGIKKVKNYFPNSIFTTYSSEEPCFTSALPQILHSFGISYASLKNPNTCWGGYTRAHGGELVNWMGPDGTKIFTVPRYDFEKLKPGSTWETIGSSNSSEYINAAFEYGIKKPIGMCLQDAGWRWGPWLKGEEYKPTKYVTWREYFTSIVDKSVAVDWKFSQEDVLVSLVWGSQVLQKLAQEIRVSERKLIQVEKIATMQTLQKNKSYPSLEIDNAWKSLLLAQHHDCWIVPYNGSKGDTWADKVKNWTDVSNRLSDSIIKSETVKKQGSKIYIKVYNTLAQERKELIMVDIPADWKASNSSILDAYGKSVPTQILALGKGKIAFQAKIPSFGYGTYQLVEKRKTENTKSYVKMTEKGTYILENDLYKITVDPKKGGVITSLIAKKIDNKEFVDQNSDRKFNELRGNFYKKGRFYSSTEKSAKVEILENGSELIKVAVHGNISDNPFVQTITLVTGQERIDLDIKIDWKQNEGIGEFEETKYEPTNLKKAFYNDQYKLLSLFPLNLKNQKVYKNAPFDVLESKLDNTFYSSWDSIKNNMIVNWVDVTDENEVYGCALYTDHTTSYAHSKDFPLGLNIQYSGKGLWGFDYEINRPTEIKYALIPHKGNWEKANLWEENEKFEQPLIPLMISEKPNTKSDSWFKNIKKGWVVSSSTIKDGEIYLRIFNVGNNESGKINFGFNPGEINLVELSGKELKQIPVQKNGNNYLIDLSMPQFGIRTLKISNFKTEK